MKIFFAIALSILGFQMTVNASETPSVKIAFIAKMNGKILQSTGSVEDRNPPCSTFKVPLALMGFDSGILKDKDFPKWVFKKEYENNFQSWYKPEMGIKYGWHGEHTPASFLQKSVVWFSHKITKELGKEKFQEYVNKLNYGNKDISGTPGKDDGLLNSWLETSLKISPQEQVELLEKMLATSLDVSKNAQIKTREIMVKKDPEGQPIEWNGWKVYGKTGGGTGCNRWFIGWVEKGEDKIIFAQYIGLTKDTPEIRVNTPMAIDLAKENIIGLLGRL